MTVQSVLPEIRKKCLACFGECGTCCHDQHIGCVLFDLCTLEYVLSWGHLPFEIKTIPIKRKSYFLLSALKVW